MEMSLEKRVLASIETHKRMLVESMVLLFPHEKKDDVIVAIDNLVRKQWVKITTDWTHNKIKVSKPLLVRTDKEMFSQPELF